MAIRCDRCGAVVGVHTVSFFNLDLICVLCSEEEKDAPNYAKARQVEEEHTLEGVRLLKIGDPAYKTELNFPGIGLSDEDRAYLAERRARRGDPLDAGMG